MKSKTPPKHIVAVGGLVTNQQNQVLLLHSPRGDWEFPGGQVEEGETLTQALQREILEESGITASVGELVGVYSNLHSPYILMFGFLCRWVAGEPTTSSESLAVEWVKRNEALARIVRPSIHARLKDMLDFTGQVVYRAYSVEPNAIHAGYTVHEERMI